MQERIKRYRLGIMTVAGFVALVMTFFLTDPGAEGRTAAEWIAAAAALCLFLGLCAGIDAGEKRGQLKPEQLFLILSVPISLAMMVSIPLDRIPDESSHLMRSWQVSIGELLPTRENCGIFWQPVNLESGWSGEEDLTLQRLFTLQDQILDTTVHIQAPNVRSNTGVYPVSNYFPQALGMWMMRLFTNNRLLILYAGRLGAWVLTTALFYYSIQKMPLGKYICMAVCFFPTMIQQAVSAGADGMTCGFAFAFLAYVLDLRENPRVLTIRDYVMLLVLGLGLSTFKIMYFPLIFLAAVIPETCFVSKKRKAAVASVVILLCVGTVAGWLLLCKKLYADTAIGTASKEGNLLPQAMFILEDPIRFFKIVLKTVVPNLPHYAGRVLGRELAWPNVFLPKSLSALQAMAILGAFVWDRSMPKRGTGKLRFGVLALSSLSVLVIATALYLYFTPYAHPSVDGMQGRYFLPLLPGVLLAVKFSGALHEDESLARTCVCLLGLLNVSTVLSAFVQLWN